jgi:hypothetical protein
MNTETTMQPIEAAELMAVEGGRGMCGGGGGGGGFGGIFGGGRGFGGFFRFLLSNLNLTFITNIISNSFNGNAVLGDGNSIGVGLS